VSSQGKSPNFYLNCHHEQLGGGLPKTRVFSRGTYPLAVETVKSIPTCKSGINTMAASPDELVGIRTAKDVAEDDGDLPSDVEVRSDGEEVSQPDEEREPEPLAAVIAPSDLQFGKDKEDDNSSAPDRLTPVIEQLTKSERLLKACEAQSADWVPPEWCIRPSDKKMFVAINLIVSKNWMKGPAVSKLLPPEKVTQIDDRGVTTQAVQRLIISPADAGVTAIPALMGARAGKYVPIEELLKKAPLSVRLKISPWVQSVRETVEFTNRMRELSGRNRPGLAARPLPSVTVSQKSKEPAPFEKQIVAGALVPQLPAPSRTEIVPSSQNSERTVSQASARGTFRQLPITDLLSNMPKRKQLDWDFLTRAMDLHLQGLPEAIREWAESKFDIDPSHRPRLMELIAGRVQGWATTQCGHADDDGPSHVHDLPQDGPQSEKYWVQFGLVRRNGQWACDACSLVLPATECRLSDLQRHVIKDSHDLAALKRRGHFCLAGGLEAREAYRDLVRQRDAVDLSKVTKIKLSDAERQSRAKQWSVERARRVNDLRVLPIVPVDLNAKSVDPSSDADTERIKNELNTSFLKAWLAANIPMASIDGMWEWLRDHAVHGNLLAKRSWLARHYDPICRGDQETRIIDALKCAKGDGLLVMLDGSTDIAHDQKPVNFLVATNKAIFYCDTQFMDPGDTDDHEAYFPLVREFARKWLPGDLPDFVWWIATDNESKMCLLVKKLSDAGGLFPKADGLGCLAHGAARIGTIVTKKPCVSHLCSLCTALSGLLKGQVFVHRRWVLRKALTAEGRDASTLPDKWGGTRWDCWYLCVVFVARNIGFLQKWIKSLKSDAHAWANCLSILDKHGSLIKVQSLFIMHTFKHLYSALDKMFQLSPLPRGSNTVVGRTHNHVLYNKFEEICTALSEACSIEGPASLSADVVSAMQHGKISFASVKPILTEIAGAAHTIAKKYRDNSTGQLAKAMRVFDPAQRYKWGVDNLDDFVRVLPRKLHPQLTESDSGAPSEWSKYFDIPNPPVNINLLEWWRSMSSTLPCLSKQADRMLRLTLTTIQVEASFSTYKQTRTAQQWNMTDDTHITRMSYSFNGVMPQQKGGQAPTEGARVREERPPVRRKAQDVTEVEDTIECDGSGSTDLPLGALTSKPSGNARQKTPAMEHVSAKRKAEVSVGSEQAAGDSKETEAPQKKVKREKREKQVEASAQPDPSVMPMPTAVINADDPARQLHDF